MKKIVLLLSIIFLVIGIEFKVSAACLSGKVSNENGKPIIEVSLLPAVVKGSEKNFNLIGVTVSKEVNSLEEHMRSLSGSVQFKPHEVKFILLKRG